ncbi:MAG: hypothetical protein FJX47_05870, partial [Alphaproteobacteria bacterium]|nr:hypothetical protein [Alphaproteobacteria bacterium]
MAQTTSELDEYRDGGEVPMGRLATVDLDALMAAEVGHDPCDLVVVPGFVRREALIAANAGFPHIGMPGSFPLPLFKLGPGLEQLVADLESEEFR